MTLTDIIPDLEALRRRGKVAAVDALARVRAIGARAETIAQAVQAHEAGRAAMVAVPFSEVVATVQAIEDFIGLYYEDLDFPPELFQVLRALQQSLFNLQTLRRAFASQALLTSALSNAFVPSPAPLTPYRIRQGDTLERIALETMQDISRASEIIDLNDLLYPYLDSARDYVRGEFSTEFDPQGFRVTTTVDREGVPDGVRVTGEVIYLPSDAVVPRNAQYTDRDVELWGRDIAIDRDGFLAIDADGEFRTVEGKDNIEQALGQRIQVTRGELVLDPDYGIERLLAVGVEGTIANALFSAIAVARTIRDDPRVTNVRDVVASLVETTNAASMTVGLIGASQATIPVNLVIPESVVVAG